MNVKALIGSGDTIMKFTLPVAVAGLILNYLNPRLLSIQNPPGILTITAILMTLLGVSGWLWSAVLILTKVPKKELITDGPYAVVLHPLYTAVGLLVLPGLSILLGSWLGVFIGIALYAGSRLFAPREERDLAKTFGARWTAYRNRVLIPWL